MWLIEKAYLYSARYVANALALYMTSVLRVHERNLICTPFLLGRRNANENSLQFVRSHGACLHVCMRTCVFVCMWVLAARVFCRVNILMYEYVCMCLCAWVQCERMPPALVCCQRCCCYWCSLFYFVLLSATHVNFNYKITVDGHFPKRFRQGI